ncbi:hypothetical protein GGR50DRAFT_440100 [Xylaria sp. CBS 124048]|nr:hypothetical protein GGR50DRAFT_440100 [Xylaria sp. CBS 124048]
MPGKRKRILEDDSTCSPITHKRPRRGFAPDLLSPLSDELLVRILLYLPLFDLLNLAPVSRRFYHLSGDSQIWKRLYYLRFVLPRALRTPGFRDGSARDGSLQYSSRQATWTNGRKGGWVDMRFGGGAQDHNWKRQYKLRHNWARGKCAVEELHLGDESRGLHVGNSPKMHVKVLQGIAVTADSVTGLRAWDLKTKSLIAQASLSENDCHASPTCLELDGQLLSQGSIDIALGFGDGSFGTWRLHVPRRQIVSSYRHEGSSNGEIIGIAFLHPYVLTATTSILISLYTFDRPPPLNRQNHLEEAESNSRVEQVADGETAPESDTEVPDRMGNESKPKLSAPYLLTSLKSHTSRAPLALYLRKTSGSAIASIAYTFSTIRGWSLGIQELHIRPIKSRSRSHPEITATQLAYTTAVNSRSRRHRHFTPSSPVAQADSAIHPAEGEEGQLDGPINLSYTHPYLLATLPDNTLILHLCTSGSSSLSISPGIRLWGHTSGISDAEITSRGKAVSVSTRGGEIRVWELEGRTNGQSIEVRPACKAMGDGDDAAAFEQSFPEHQLDDRRNWVGFDDEMVIVLKESNEGRESLLVYDFT